MNQTIICAIHNRKLLTFTYNGHSRTVEPHTYGVTTTGNESLLAYQTNGGHASGHKEPWHLFNLSKMEKLTLSTRSFTGPRHGYKRTKPAMKRIYIQL